MKIYRQKLTYIPIQAYPEMEDEGDCDNDTDCSGNLICGSKNCGANFHQLADCCKEPNIPNIPNITPEFSLSESGKL